ncbi:winged helix-turn-helix transcriptional regulator [Streptomyces sp. SID13666]|uniref:GntR family transcriptional regulator n=1 Tax=unclassified Streptomyces TaxID=2593676 RepID=UPI0013C2525B|nr:MULTISPECIES: winged helix-turn-helix domain-containing protein [unclassified Streptomyces]NEA59404.1 winged helix-turn-helix transcriptional regulator [Streptomyces sp. SID13666]NEA72476.1 winged helix-turn-helix transcriptional regulator [Streptomyces sp. SID13588]
MSLPRDSHTPPYRLVADEIRQQIRSGRIKPGERVPSSRELEATHGIANMTARSALRVLRDEGLIYSTPGRGNFVVDTLPPDTGPQAGTDPSEPRSMPSAEYLQLSERLDALNARLDGLLEVFQQLGAVTGPKKK